MPSPRLESTTLWALSGAAVGTVVGALLYKKYYYYYYSTKYYSHNDSPSLSYQRDRRRRLPKTIIVVRHGESEANANPKLWESIPDNQVELSKKGHRQAKEAGKRVAKVLQARNAQNVHLIMSPFIRTQQTASNMMRYFDRLISRVEVESRVREQEMGNVQGEMFKQYRTQQKQIGRFFYRFPTGESGADVYDRVKTWWNESVLTVNARYGHEPVDTLVVVTHGLTMRFILMQLYGWSPHTFHSVWNAGNCAMYVLTKDLDKLGMSPYVLDTKAGDMPKSSIPVRVTLQSTGEVQELTLKDYLKIKPPRKTRTEMMKRMLASQDDNDIDSYKDIEKLEIVPFMARVPRGKEDSTRVISKEYSFHDGGGTVVSDTGSDSEGEEDSSSDGASNHVPAARDVETTEDHIANGQPPLLRGDNVVSSYNDESDHHQEEDEDDVPLWCTQTKPAKREESMRFPCILSVPGLDLLEDSKTIHNNNNNHSNNEEDSLRKNVSSWRSKKESIQRGIAQLIDSTRSN